MTNREALEQLKKLKSFHNGSYGEAINLAIDLINERLQYPSELHRIVAQKSEADRLFEEGQDGEIHS